MKSIKKSIRGISLICLIILVSLGVGISGGIPIPFSNKRKQTSDVNIELVEARKEEEAVKEIDSKR